MVFLYVVQSEDEHGRPARKRGPVRFDQDVRSDVSQAPLSLLCCFVCLVINLYNIISGVVLLQVDQLRQAVRNLKSEQNRLTGELEREKEDRARLVLSQHLSPVS